MKSSDLQNIFIEELKSLLPDWEFIKSRRHFKKAKGSTVWFFHITCINHLDDFDAVGDVAVEFRVENDRACIVGAELGNIEGTGQRRFPVHNVVTAKSSAHGLFDFFQKFGLPFLIIHSNPVQVVATLERGGKQAMLISPILYQHKEQITQLRNYFDHSM
ncbi:MAG: hypothetical protein AAF431_08430 [Pseudomonadota bacterium]